MKKGSIDIQGLYDLIIDLRTKIDKHRELFVKNEAAVRYALAPKNAISFPAFFNT